MAGQLRQHDVGSVIRVAVHENGVPFNASSATGKFIKFKKPSGTVEERPAVFDATDGTNGVVQYVTVEDDLDESGPWTGQVLLNFANGTWHTAMFNFTVGANLS